ncbi:MAG: hypothetical protein JO290_08565 [Sphingomonadaceae bacterium]|nr:hypothetical protein [Sphingomonadaceae bacterium]
MAAGAPGTADEVTLSVGGNTIGGWTDVEITRGAEHAPNTFDVGLTALGPDGAVTVARAGDACTVAIGGDTVVTGYVDRDVNEGDAASHRLRIIGRGKCADLVDCSAELPNGQVRATSVVDLAMQLAKPYGIVVVLAADTDVGPAVPDTNLNFGETPYDLIAGLSRAAGVLAYENAGGDLVISTVGKVKAASGAAYGQNVQAWSTVNAMDERYQTYVCTHSSIEILGDVSDAGFFYGEQTDPEVKRHRKLFIVQHDVAGAEGAFEFTKRRAIWEAARRQGRGTQVRVTVDSWRDSAGRLWEPNTLVPVDVPGLRLAEKLLVLSSVTYRRDDAGGTTADLFLMPSAAFTPEPIVVQPINTTTDRGQLLPLNP